LYFFTNRLVLAGSWRWSMSLKKSLDFFDSGMLQLFDFELRPYRSNDSIERGAH
jgi:hypothetical protein